MAEKQEIFNRINELLESTGLTIEINDVSGLEEFLENEDNQQYEEYEEIESLYNELMDYSVFDDDET
ncbi:MAG TPA: hypothetical protein VHT96_13385 [Clostridia bacterium]|nr:hypothetical protein [Clostridia bacterium]